MVKNNSKKDQKEKHENEQKILDSIGFNPESFFQIQAITHIPDDVLKTELERLILEKKIQKKFNFYTPYNPEKPDEFDLIQIIVPPHGFFSNLEVNWWFDGKNFISQPIYRTLLYGFEMGRCKNCSSCSYSVIELNYFIVGDPDEEFYSTAHKLENEISSKFYGPSFQNKISFLLQSKKNNEIN